LWAVGATLYTLITGKFVHAGENAQETLALAATRPARSIAELRPDLHPSLIAFIDQALSYDRAARFPDAATMQHVLRLTYAQMEGRDANDGTELRIPDLQSIPTARAITVRNLKPPGRLTKSGQPTVKRSSAPRVTKAEPAGKLQQWFRATAGDRRNVWLIAATAVVFVLIGFLALRSPVEPLPVIPVAGVAASPAPAGPAATPGGATSAGPLAPAGAAPSKAGSSLVPERSEPKAIRVDDLPREPVRGFRGR
jgi:hypothetical protein